MLTEKRQLPENQAPTSVSEEGPQGSTELHKKSVLSQARKQKAGFLLPLLGSDVILPELSKLR